MIGQTKLLNTIDSIISTYPKFSIIEGAKGSGKKLIVQKICKMLNLPIIPFGTSIDEVRQVIALSYEQVEPLCYVCYDADNMSLGAKNALLKITEEPPNNAYFILTLQSISNTLGTLKSRGTLLSLDPYSMEEILEYRKQKGYDGKYDRIVKDVCTTLGDVEELYKYLPDRFYNFAETVAFKIQLPTSGNIFKISKAVKSKKDDEGYDATLLFKTVRNLYIKKALETKRMEYLLAANVTTKCLQDLAIPVVNVVGTIDKWIMDVRSVLRGV